MAQQGKVSEGLSTEAVTNIFAPIFQGGVASSKLDLLRQNVTQDAKFHIVGQEFSLASKHQGLDAIHQNILTPIEAALDTSKPHKSEFTRVVAGDDGWVAAEVVSTGTSKSGKFSPVSSSCVH